MNLGEMCRAAARYSDRYDEYVKTAGPDGTEGFEGEALHWFQLFRDAVNEAYFEISRSRLTPETQVECELGEDGVIDMEWMYPPMCSVCGVYRADGATEIGFVFRTRTQIEIEGAKAGEKVTLRYHYLPERLEAEDDEPVFSEAAVDPAIYIALAVARVWQSERRMSAAQPWLAEYYQRLRELRGGRRPNCRKRLPRRPFR